MTSKAVIQGLQAISRFEDIHVEDEKVKRRSSVAVIIRFRPADREPSGPEDSLAPGATNDPVDLQTFLNGDLENYIPEILFIKRSSRIGDRWSSHIALPGGRRDPEDSNDIETAVRETREEVGLDLIRDGIYVGPLDQRLVKTSWGRNILMTLCSHVFILSKYDAPLTLEPAEIALSFWVPISELLNPVNDSIEIVPVGDRLKLETWRFLPKAFYPCIKAMVGDMIFGAIDLHVDRQQFILPHKSSEADNPQLLKGPFKLWGLTLGVITDFIEVIQPGALVNTLRFPTLRNLDLRLAVYILSFRHVNGKRRSLKAASLNGYKAGGMDLAGKALDGYFLYIQKAVPIAIAIRLAVALFGVCKIMQYLYRR